MGANVGFYPQVVAKQNSCTRDLGPRSRDPFARSSLVARAGPSTDDNFCGSKAGATFRLAMISIGSGLKPRASQRCRNNCLTLEMENGAPADFLGEPQRPPPWCVRGRGDGERSHGLKLNYYVHVLYLIAGMMAASRTLA